MERLNTWARAVPSWAVYLLGAVPGIWVIVAGLAAIDPVRDIERGLGIWALRLILLGLAITPLRWAGVNLLRHRRAIGLLAFFYVVVHLMAWLGLDMGFRWSQIAADLVKRWYIILGMLGFVLMIPLALTSSDKAIRRLRGAWGRLHKLVYPAAVLGLVHYILVQKVWEGELYVYGAILVGLLGLRFWKWGLRRTILG